MSSSHGSSEREIESAVLIKDIHESTHINLFLGLTRIPLLLVFEVTCYIVFIGLVISAFYIPHRVVVHAIAITNEFHILRKAMSPLLYNVELLKFLLFMSSFIPLLCGYLFHGLRKRLKLMSWINQETEEFMEKYELK